MQRDASLTGYLEVTLDMTFSQKVFFHGKNSALSPKRGRFLYDHFKISNPCFGATRSTFTVFTSSTIPPFDHSTI